MMENKRIFPLPPLLFNETPRFKCDHILSVYRAHSSVIKAISCATRLTSMQASNIHAVICTCKYGSNAGLRNAGMCLVSDAAGLASSPLWPLSFATVRSRSKTPTKSATAFSLATSSNRCSSRRRRKAAANVFRGRDENTGPSFSSFSVSSSSDNSNRSFKSSSSFSTETCNVSRQDVSRCNDLVARSSKVFCMACLRSETSSSTPNDVSGRSLQQQLHTVITSLTFDSIGSDNLHQQQQYRINFLEYSKSISLQYGQDTVRCSHGILFALLDSSLQDASAKEVAWHSVPSYHRR